MTRKSVLTLDEHLLVFLGKWKAARSAQVAKWSTKARRYRKEHGKRYPGIADIIDAQAEKRCRDAKHELAMLDELHRRSLHA